MATGGYDSSVDSRVTCSICLEPYQGRQPKWLPCSHTFCLPCLTQIADKQATTFPKIVSGSDEDDRVTTITCPTCRTHVPLPPGGVAKLHNNMYVDGSDELSGTPPSPSSPSSSTKPQRINCDLCEEGQGQEAKFTCSGCQACFCARCRRMHDKICKSSQVKEIKVQPADDGDKDLASAVEKMMKRMSELEKTVATQQTLIAGLQSHVTGLQNQNTMLHDKNTQLEKQSKRDRNSLDSLEKELISVKDKIAIMCQDNQELHNDFGKFQNKVTEVQDGHSKGKNDVSKIDGTSNIQSNIAKMQAQLDQMQTEHNKETMELKQTTGRAEQDIQNMKYKLNQHIAFHVINTDRVPIEELEIIACDEVVFNVGDGYNETTGVFTAPMSGMFCFMATSSPDSSDEEDLCKLSIVVNDEQIAFLCANGISSTTAHAVVRMNTGDKAWLAGEEDGFIADGWNTSFTGMLVQPDL